MAESVFKTRTLKQIYDEVRKVYLSDNRPWILGFSGGKDSTCMAQLVWNALSELSADELQKKIYIISSDTLVESPKIVSRITNTLNNMEDAAKQSHLPVSTNLLRPKTQDTFWVSLLGLGYPAWTSHLDIPPQFPSPPAVRQVRQVHRSAKSARRQSAKSGAFS